MGNSTGINTSHFYTKPHIRGDLYVCAFLYIKTSSKCKIVDGTIIETSKCYKYGQIRYCGDLALWK